MSKSLHLLAELYESIVLEHSLQKQAIVIDPSKGDREFQTSKFTKEFKDLGGKSKHIKQQADNIINSWRAAKGVNQPIFELKFSAKINLETLPLDVQQICNMKAGKAFSMPIYGVEVLKRNPPTHLLAIKLPSNILKAPNTSVIMWLRAFDDYDVYTRTLTQLRGGI